MDKKEAEVRFQKADKLFTYGRYDDALVELDLLVREFPDNYRLLNAKARTLEQLGRLDESLALCDRLLHEFNYDKARTMRDRIAQEMQKRSSSAPQKAFWGNEPAPDDAAPDPAAQTPSDTEPRKRRFRVKPIRLLLLIALIALMYFQKIPYPLGGGLIAAYFIIMYGVKFLVMWAIKRLFTAPFKMKGKALEGATCQLHGYQWTEKPVRPRDDEDETEEPDTPGKPLRYVWLDVTITPQQRTQGFTHWEPGELMLAPLGMKFKGMDDMDNCLSIHDVKLVVDGQVQEDEGAKYHGPQRLKLLAAVPVDEHAFKFVYYFEQFGELKLTA